MGTLAGNGLNGYLALLEWYYKELHNSQQLSIFHIHCFLSIHSSKRWIFITITLPWNLHFHNDMKLKMGLANARKMFKFRVPWSLFYCNWTKYGYLLCKSPYSVRMRINVDQTTSEFGHFLCSECQSLEKAEYKLCKRFDHGTIFKKVTRIVWWYYHLLEKKYPKGKAFWEVEKNGSDLSS